MVTLLPLKEMPSPVQAASLEQLLLELKRIFWWGRTASKSKGLEGLQGVVKWPFGDPLLSERREEELCLCEYWKVYASKVDVHGS